MWTSALGILLLLAAWAIVLHIGANPDSGLRIFDGGAAFALAVVGSSLVAG